MTARIRAFDEQTALQEVKCFLPTWPSTASPAGANPLKAFQSFGFHEALRQAREILGLHTTLSLDEYRSFYNSKK